MVLKIALLNEYYIFVKEESVQRGVQISEHPVESGLNVTDNVKRNAKVIRLTGEIVGEDAQKTLENIEALHNGGKFVKYIGRNILANALITSFDTGHTNEIHGGCSFEMDIKEVRISKSPLVVKKKSNKKKTSSGKKQTTKKSTKNTKTKTYKVKKGDTLWSIAKKYYGKGAKYTKIVNANKKLIKNPKVIQIGWKLKIPA